MTADLFGSVNAEFAWVFELRSQLYSIDLIYIIAHTVKSVQNLHFKGIIHPKMKTSI